MEGGKVSPQIFGVFVLLLRKISFNLFALIGMPISKCPNCPTQRRPGGAQKSNERLVCLECAAFLLPNFASSHGILPRPFPCTLVVLVRVCLVQPGDFWNKGIVWVGVTEKGTDGKEHL